MSKEKTVKAGERTRLTPDQIMEALQIFIKSGSANGNEPMRVEMLRLVSTFAAAPDLLEACRRALQVFEVMQRPPTVIVDLKLAVAKAEGNKQS